MVRYNCSLEVSYIPDKAINFKVDDVLYKQVKIKVINNDTTIKDYIINLIKQDLEKDK